MRIRAKVTIVAVIAAVEKRGKVADRRRVTRNGRRATDIHPAEGASAKMAREISQLKNVVQILVDAVQALTGSRGKR